MFWAFSNNSQEQRRCGSARQQTADRLRLVLTSLGKPPLSPLEVSTDIIFFWIHSFINLKLSITFAFIPFKNSSLRCNMDMAIFSLGAGLHMVICSRTALTESISHSSAATHLYVCREPEGFGHAGDTYNFRAERSCQR